MLFADVVNRGTLPALEKVLAYTEARNRVLAENVANADTPGYLTKHLDPAAFQRSLREAMGADRAREAGSGEPPSSQDVGFALRPTDQFHQDASGRLVVTPTAEPAENVLFHDGTNMRIEQQMAMLAENAMMHQTAAELLRGQFENLLKAIRGTVR